MYCAMCLINIDSKQMTHRPELKNEKWIARVNFGTAETHERSECAHYTRPCLARRKQLVSEKKNPRFLANQIAEILRPIV